MSEEDQNNGSTKKSKTADEFTAEEFTAIKSMAHVAIGLGALGSVGQFLLRVLLWCVMLVGALIAIQNGLIEYLKNLLRS